MESVFQSELFIKQIVIFYTYIKLKVLLFCSGFG